ncbi:hypothetical protein BC835DRAFT_1422151 [Cytidiella melzeri]|nr:hypothetical protein BC835DRAFT_1422151 [Cytidiella melzeri]
MAGGMWNDGEYNWKEGEFHRHYFETREKTRDPSGRSLIRQRLLETTLDLTTALDRVSGGATLLLHIDGNLPPGLPRAPDVVKVSVYATPYIKSEIPNGEIVVAQLTQSFVEAIALPSIEQWEQALSKTGEILPMTTMAEPDSPLHKEFGLGLKTKTSCLRHIYGRPYGALEGAIKTLHPSFPVKLENPSAEDYESVRSLLEESQEECRALLKDLTEAQDKVRDLEARLAAKEKDLEEAVTGLSAIRMHADRLLGDLAPDGGSNGKSKAVPATEVAQSPSSSSHANSASAGPSTSTAHMQESAELIMSFGPACHDVITRFDLLLETHLLIWSLFKNVPANTWYENLVHGHRYTAEAAHVLAVAMHEDTGNQLCDEGVESSIDEDF